MAAPLLRAVSLEVAGWAFATPSGKAATKALIRMAPAATVGDFMVAIRAKLPPLQAEQAMYAFWNGVELAAMSTPLSHLVLKHASKNGRLPVVVRAENTFGGPSPSPSQSH